MKYPKELTVKDHSVSQELFTLRFNEEYEMYETHPQPSEEHLPYYYESEDYISHTGSKRNFFEHLYHRVRSIMLGIKLRMITQDQAAPGQLLDVGCGTGDFLLAAKKKGWQAIGIEPNKQAQQVAIAKGLKIFDGKHLNSLDANSFDVITLWHVLEHLPQLEDQISHFKRLLKPHGTLVLAVPNFKSNDARHYKSNWAAYDVPRHLWHFSKISIKRLFEKQGFDLIETKPMWFDAIYVSMLSEKIKGSQLGFFKGAFFGVLSNLKGLYTNEFSSHIYILRPQS